jgi:2,5-diketo-D-gluconate reductase A
MTVPDLLLNDGNSIPQLGLGIWQASPEETERIVRFAIDEAGYRHIDGAKIYANEEGLGRAVAASSVPREDLFITTKLWFDEMGREQPLKAIDASLSRLGMDYVDLYLIHWPLQDPAQLAATWLAMEDILASGKARSIGVSNHRPADLENVIAAGSIVPVLNQVELHPRFAQGELRAENARHGIATESWSPLGGTRGSKFGKPRPPLLEEPVLVEVGEKHGRSAAQVVIRWHLQNGLVVIPKSITEARIAENIDVFGFELDADDLAAIATLDAGDRVGASPDEVG